ncbi:MAG: beta strand repeat-containing protein [Cyclobacteriaceae bacterium]
MKKICLLILTTLMAGSLSAQVPSTISYQGFYTDASGVPINDNASQSHTVKFDFFRGSETNSAFSRTIENVKVIKGLFSVVIGRNVTAEDGTSNTPLSIDDIHTSASYSVQVTIDGTVIGNKVPLTAVPYAMTAGKVSGSNVTGTIDAAQVVGSGAGLTNLNASNLATGTIADARLESTVDIGALNVGASGELAISNTGNITKIKGLTYDFPSSHSTGTTFLSNNGSGTLAWSGLPSNVPTGTGATNTLALWSGANALSNDTDLSWDGGTNTLTAANFSGNGAGLTSLTAANVTGTNTLPAGVLPTSVPIGNGAADQVTLWSGSGTVSSNANLTWNGTTNTLSATNFSGNGSGLTSLTAANLTGANTLPAGVLPTTVPIGNGATNRLTFWSGTGTVSSNANLTWSEITNTLSATNFSGNGASLSSLSASNISSGTLSNGRLSTDVDVTGNVTTGGGLHVGSATAPGTDNLEVDGYTKLGGSGVSVTGSTPSGALVSWPSVRMLKITGTAAAADGTANITLSGLTDSKILSIDVMIEYTTGDYVHAGYTATGGLQFNFYFQNGILNIRNITGNSASLAGKPFKAIIIYEE